MVGNILMSNLEKNIVDETVSNLLKEGKQNQIEAELNKISIDDLSSVEKEAWFQVRGILAFQRADHIDAVKWFNEGLHHVPTSQKIMFSLGQEYIFLKKPKDAFALFDKCEFPEVSSQFVLAMSRYAYLYDEYERGMAYTSQFFTFYWQLKILDDNFLYMRRLPFFSVAWDHFAVHCILGKHLDELKKITLKAKTTCSDFDFDNLDLELRAHTENDYKNLIEQIKARISNALSNFPSGYSRARLACFESFYATDYQDAISQLDNLKLAENDHQWLLDIILLAKANLANKFNMRIEEEKYVTNFLMKQPLLFEPEHAWSFGLLSYQEKLKYTIR